MTAEGPIAGAADLARKHEEKIRFLFVGGLNTVVGYALFALWYFLLERLNLGPLHYNLALGISWIMSVPIGYSNLKRWVFKTRGTNWVAELGRSYMVYMGALLVNYAVLNFFVLVLHMHPLVGQFASIFVVTVISFIGHKYFTFGNKHVIEAIDDGGVFDEPSE